MTLFFITNKKLRRTNIFTVALGTLAWLGHPVPILELEVTVSTVRSRNLK